jgi:tRNA A37 N6-isopentenylltransferase MiaA
MISMNEKWKKLIQQFEESGYTPNDIQRIVHFYDVTMETDKMLKKLYEEEENEHTNSDFLHHERQ